MGIQLNELKVQENLKLDSLGVEKDVSVGEVGVNVETKFLDDLSVQDNIQLNALDVGDDVSVGEVGVGVETRYLIDEDSIYSLKSENDNGEISLNLLGKDESESKVTLHTRGNLLKGFQAGNDGKSLYVDSVDLDIVAEPTENEGCVVVKLVDTLKDNANGTNDLVRLNVRGEGAVNVGVDKNRELVVNLKWNTY